MSFPSFSIKKLAVAISAALPAVAFAAPGATSAYATDTQHSYVEDATSQGIGQVNMITCFMSSMRPDALVNQGNYLALVDKSKCDPNSRSSTSNSGSGGSGSQGADYMTSTVNSTRSSNSSPMLAKIWVDNVEEDHSATIFVHLTATAAPTATNPYGVFRMDYCGRGINPSTSQLMPSCMMNGFLEGTTSGINYYETEDQPNHAQTTSLKLNASGTDSGSGRLDMIQTENNSTSEQVFSFAYNHDYFLRGDQCFSRDANVAEFSVWRYGVYDANSGERLDLNSGFPIQYTPTGSSGHPYQGFLGYYGLSLPPDAMTALAADTHPQLKKVDYGNGAASTTTYDVVKAGGKLTKYTKQIRTLNQIDHIKFNLFVGNASGLFSGAQSYTQYEAYWDDASKSFKIDGSINCGGNGCQTVTFAQEQTVNPSFFASIGGVQGWSQSLGGEMFVDLHGVSFPITTSSAINVVYRVQDLVYPSDMPAQLHCLRDCPTAATIASYFAQNSMDQSPFALFSNFSSVVPGQEVIYTTDSATALLKDSQSQAVLMTDSNALSSHPQYQNGIRSGRLFTDADLANVACDDQPSNYCDYKVNSVNVYYVWETGSNSWNQFAAVKNSGGSYVHFDAPLQMNYNVPNDSAKYGEYAGKSIVLQYGGFGNLWGIPGGCVSHLTNAPISCDQPNARYVPVFTIPAGSQVTVGSTPYLVKWLEREIRFARRDMNDGISCAGLSVPSSVSNMPNSSGLNNPSDPNSSMYIGDKPTVTAAPRVIQGEVEY